ncbi:hypothetical protein H2198_003560 [Neophaeococcomyces mojaviensis]|uniref:Uncharacterized protein n=1 Tax=Neophaeococcomyces mojaviensis TaxID=3383035 RepID=A0ACC3ABG4_9EURO|nr:hypothetical protein H2198_003560 [Knufia sp. JES_112]
MFRQNSQQNSPRDLPTPSGDDVSHNLGDTNSQNFNSTSTPQSDVLPLNLHSFNNTTSVQYPSALTVPANSHPSNQSLPQQNINTNYVQNHPSFPSHAWSSSPLAQQLRANPQIQRISQAQSHPQMRPDMTAMLPRQQYSLGGLYDQFGNPVMPSQYHLYQGHGTKGRYLVPSHQGYSGSQGMYSQNMMRTPNRGFPTTQGAVSQNMMQSFPNTYPPQQQTISSGIPQPASYPNMMIQQNDAYYESPQVSQFIGHTTNDCQTLGGIMQDQIVAQAARKNMTGARERPISNPTCYSIQQLPQHGTDTSPNLVTPSQAFYNQSSPLHDSTPLIQVQTSATCAI